MSDVKYSSGISASTLLGVLFVALKLTGVIDWSWVWVTCPFWIGIAILAAISGFIMAGAGLLLLVASVLEWWDKRGKRNRQ